jgi:hypothetical protein
MEYGFRQRDTNGGVRPMRVKTAALTALVGSGVAALALAVLPTGSAFAATSLNVPCFGPGGGADGLVAAVTAANNAGGGTIRLTPGCTYTLAKANNTNPMTGANGLPVVTTPISIVGAGTTIARSSADLFRLIEVDGPGGNLTLTGLTITGGNTPGPGGGILNSEGSLTLNLSAVTRNTSQGGPLSSGGGIASGTLSGTGPVGTLVLNFSQVTDNTSNTGMGGGGGILNHAGTATLNGSQVSGNVAPNGGGIASGPGMPPGGQPGATLTVKGSRVDDNTTTSTGGGPAGAGIANGSAATIIATSVDHNTAAAGGIGGGILNHGTMTVSASQVNDNTAPSGMPGLGIGGGIANIANMPGGPPTVLTVNNFTLISGNTAPDGEGGGLANQATATLTFSAVIHNSAGAAGGIANQPPGTVELKLTLVAANAPDNCEPPGSIAGCFG